MSILKDISKNIFFFLAFLFLSCNKEEKIADKLVGQWEIREITYNGVNYKEDLYVNFMVFENQNKILIPESIHFEKDYLATWNIDLQNQKNLKVSIQCEDEVFKGTYDLKFIKNYKEKLLGIEMKSDSTKIRAFKLLQDFYSRENGW